MKEIRVLLFSSQEEKEIKISEWKIENGKTYKIGRNPEKTDITIADGTISRVHAELEYTRDGKLLIKDLGSANGTFLAGTQIASQKSIDIKIQEKINLGESKKYIQIVEYAEIVDERYKEKINKNYRKKDETKKHLSRNENPNSSSEISNKTSKEKYSKIKSSDNYKKADKKENIKDFSRERKENKESSIVNDRNESYRKPYSKSKSRSRRRINSNRDKTKRSNEIRFKNSDIVKDIFKERKDNKNYKYINLNIANKKITEKKTIIRDLSTLTNCNSKLLSDNSRILDSKTKYYEEFIKLKELEEKENIKQRLPKLINKQDNIDVIPSELEEKFQLGGLIPEKEEFYGNYNKFDHRNNFKRNSLEQYDEKHKNGYYYNKFNRRSDNTWKKINFK